MSEHEELHLFIDTNSILHYPLFDGFDWSSIHDKNICLVLCMEVVHELDRKKDHPKLGKRAQKRVKKIREIRNAGGKISRTVRLEVFSEQVRLSEFPDSLSPDAGDDRILFLLRQYKRSKNVGEVSVLTEDFGMTLRCEAMGVPFIEPERPQRIADAPSGVERELQESKMELARLKNATPAIKIIFTKDSDLDPSTAITAIELRPLPAQRNIEDELREYKDCTEKTSPRLSESQLSTVDKLERIQNPLSSPDYEQYQQDLEQHYIEYQTWLERKAKIELLEANVFALKLWLRNEGNIPAEDIDVELSLDDKVYFIDEAKYPGMVKFSAGAPPELPGLKTKIQGITASVLKDHPLDIPFLRHGPGIDQDVLHRIATKKCLEIESKHGSSSHRVKLHFPKLKHGRWDDFGIIRFQLPPSEDQSFQIKARISAANLREVSEFVIPIVVSRSTSRETEN